MNRVNISIIGLSFGLVLGVSMIARAAGLEVPEGDPLAALLNLVLNFKAMGPVAIGSLATTIIVQSLRKFLPSSIARKGAVVGLGVLYAVLQSIIGGLGILDALVLVLLTSGGAVALYEWVIKPIIKPKP